MQSTSWTQLCKIGREAALLNSAVALLHWDQETYMPEAGGAARAEQIALLSRLIHEKKTSREFGEALAQADESPAVREWRRDFDLATKLPTEFVEEFASLTSIAQQAWAQARKRNAFDEFAPVLEKVVEACRRKADFLGWEEHPYDALLDAHEPEMTYGEVKKLFGAIKEPIMGLLKGERGQPEFLFQEFEKDKQMAFSDVLLEVVGFDRTRARVDLSAHPFCCNLHPNDGRITSHIIERNPMYHLSAVMHEGGHWLYEANLPEEHFGTPLCEAISMAIHESQSRWWECWVGQSFGFWREFFPRLQKVFPEQLGKVSLEEFHAGINAIKTTPIRVDADEVSYPLHVILRFEIESELVAGEMKVEELPEIWSAKMKEYLQIVPENDAKGCLQDIHWSMGAIGYFPTYALGNMYAAQFFDAFEREHPDWTFEQMRGWLAENIHQHGRTYTAKELVKRVTGAELSPKPYLNYLNGKYR